MQNKSGGIDGVHVNLIKMFSYNNGFLQTLVYIYNLSISLGEFPDHFKKAEIVPIHKAGCKNQPTNYYRPISLISNFAKILEQIIHK